MSIEIGFFETNIRYNTLAIIDKKKYLNAELHTKFMTVPSSGSFFETKLQNSLNEMGTTSLNMPIILETLGKISIKKGIININTL